MRFRTGVALKWEKRSAICRLARQAGRTRTTTSGAPFCWHAVEKNTTVTPKPERSLQRQGKKPDPIKTHAKAAPRRLYGPTVRGIMSLKYLITSVGSFSSVLYHPPAHLTAFGTPCCKLVTLGFLTPDPHLNRNQPRVQQRKHPTVGGFGHFLSPGPLATLPARWQKERLVCL